MRLVMMGTGMFAEPTFEAILGSEHSVVGLVTQPDRTVGERRGSTRQVGRGMKEIAREHGLAVFQPDSINTPESVARLREWQPDLLVVAAYGQILSKDVLASATRGGINVHASLLPKYRGAAPIAWAIYHGETETGVTIIHMTPALDAGDMLAQEALAIGADETAGELEARLGVLGARLTRKVLPQIEANQTKPIPQDKSKVSKAPKLTKEMGLIDWTRSAVAVRNHIRAMQPWPGPYTFLHRQGQPPLRLLIFHAAFGEPSTPGKAEPGGIIKEGTRLFARTGDGWLELLELQPAGKRRMNAADFLRGNVLSADANLAADAV
jgi:methionyl-tRNA formyltransferase